MIQSMEILQLPIMDLQERIQQELQENPVLEIEGARRPRSRADEDGRADAESRDPDADALDHRRRPTTNSTSTAWKRSTATGTTTSTRSTARRATAWTRRGDKKHDAMQNMASRPQSLQDYLTEQLGFLDMDAGAERAAALRHRPHRRQRLPRHHADDPRRTTPVTTGRRPRRAGRRTTTSRSPSSRSRRRCRWSRSSTRPASGPAT